MYENSPEFKKKITVICSRDDRYHPDSYAYISSAVGKIADEINTDNGSKRRHISGKELVEGLVHLLLHDYDCLAFDVLKFWGIHNTEDFGNIVFNLVDEKLLSVSHEDSIDDFKNKGDFYALFVAPFVHCRPNPPPLRTINCK